MWHERRRQQSADVALAIERARQRKEEEEQRYQETTQVSWHTSALNYFYIQCRSFPHISVTLKTTIK